MPGLQSVIDFEEVDGADTAVLQEALQVLESQIILYQDFAMNREVPDFVPDKRQLIVRILRELNRRRSADGMSPDQP